MNICHATGNLAQPASTTPVQGFGTKQQVYGQGSKFQPPQSGSQQPIKTHPQTTPKKYAGTRYLAVDPAQQQYQQAQNLQVPQ